jgi:hypothetical protein
MIADCRGQVAGARRWSGETGARVRAAERALAETAARLAGR